MKKFCNTNILKRISNLLQDYETSKILNEKFVTPFPINLKIFSVSNWPHNDENSIIWPREIQNVKENYMKFYKSNFPDRKLNFIISQVFLVFLY